ncbi:tripartite motif-containing protein 66 [Antennarius striatus]|uniref:tripartite motif-containing protein 66 n=1 Tax=Antennarius striatus TaxID=241820 RepID=UPI0035B09F87
MEKRCSECSEPAMARSLCTLCNKWLCYPCTDVHQHQRPPPAPGAPQRPDLHQRGCSSGQGSYPRPPPMCHSHRQEPLEIFCESCDLLCCSSCQLTSHKNHRVIQTSRALQEQRWLFDRLMVQVEERRSAVENGAKQTQDRLRGVKIAHRKAENQIKMAKMIMMNELNKRANLLIEQLQTISEDVQRRLEDHLQGAIEVCGQLDHIQKFITWATTPHSGDPVLFSRALISLQMQQLLEPSLVSDSWTPIKIRFNWDASYWTQQVSSLGQLTVEGGTCPYPQGVACSSILRPQPISCLALPSACHRSRVGGCGFQTSCCEPQICCLHGVPLPPPGASGMDAFCSSRCGPSCLQPAPPHQNLQLQRRWDPSSSSSHLPSSSPVPLVECVQLGCSQGTPSAQTPPQMKAFLYGGHREVHPDPDLDHRSGHCLAPAAPQQDVSLHGDVTTEDLWEDRCRSDEGGGSAGSRDPGDGPVQPVQSEPRPEQQRTRPELMVGPQRDDRRSSLEASLSDLQRESDAQRSRLSPGLVCARTARRSQSIPTELAAPSAAPHAEKPPGCTSGVEAGAANKSTAPGPSQRRASDGVPCVVMETPSNATPSRDRPSPASYKTEPEVDPDAGGRSKASTSAPHRNIQKDPGGPRVPVVCLERLKVLVSQLPPHGRRQSDPLLVSGADGNKTHPQQKISHDAVPEGTTGGGCAATRTPRTLPQPSCPERVKCHQTNTHTTASEFDPPGGTSSQTVFYALKSSSALDSDSDPRSEGVGGSCASSSELECLAGGNPVTTGELGLGADADTGRESEQSVNDEPVSDAGAGSDDVQGLDADPESCDAEMESDTQPESNPSFQTETDSDILSDQHPDSQGSELNVESEQEAASDDPRPLHSDQEEESPIGPDQKTLLIANPAALRCPELQTDRDAAEMESEDFCAVCLIGGDLLCCDRCPKVFHLSCHVPPLLSFPSGDWVCSLCRDVLQPEVLYDYENEKRPGEHGSAHGLPDADQRKCERLTLLVLSNVLSAPFQEPVSPQARHYYQIIRRPVDLSMIRARLSRRSVRRYRTPQQFVDDVFLMFQNCAKFNYPDSEVAQAGRSLEAFFVSKLKEVFPDRVFPAAEAESDSDEYDEAFRTPEDGFPWSDRREQSHRKRKRRNSLKFRRHHV